MAADPADPLLVAYPSPLLLLQYPMFAINVKFFCDKDMVARVKGQNSLTATFSALRWTYQAEGLLGVYRGAGLYFGHQALRDSLRLGTGKCFDKVWPRKKPDEERNRLHGVVDPKRDNRGLYWLRLAAKYAIEVISYPMLLASTRSIILKFDPFSTMQQFKLWSREEGQLSLFSGLTSQLLSTACDEAMDVALSACIETHLGAEIALPEKMLLKTAAASVMSIFTSPISYVGTIQRCQSDSLPGLMEPRSVSTILSGLAWKQSFYQLILFSAILGLNVWLVQQNLQAQREEDDEE